MRRWWLIGVASLFSFSGHIAWAQDGAVCREALLLSGATGGLSRPELVEYGLRPRQDVAQQILAMLDDARADAGLTRLTIDPGLAAAAEYRAFDLSVAGEVCSPGALPLEERLALTGEAPTGPLGEGTTRFSVGGFPEESYIDQAVRALQEMFQNPAFQELLLSPEIQYVGVSVLETSDEELTAVLSIAAAPSPVPGGGFPFR